MKRKILLCVMVFLSSFSLISQNANSNYNNYHARIIKIEETIVNENFQEADSLYQLLFKDYNNPFLSDVIIALQLSGLLGDNQSITTYLELAFKNGAELKHLKNLQGLKNVPKELWNNAEINYVQLRHQYYEKIDTSLLRKFTNRYLNEQKLKNTDMGPNTIKNNIRFIKQVVKEKKNFPGEKMIGIDDYNIKESNFYSSVVVVSLYHYWFGFTDFQKVLENAVDKGYLHPRRFAWIYNGEKISRKQGYGQYKNKNLYKPLFPKYNFNFLFDYYTSNLEKVNADRAKFGICSYEIDKKKLLIEKKYGIKLMFLNY